MLPYIDLSRGLVSILKTYTYINGPHIYTARIHYIYAYCNTVTFMFSFLFFVCVYC